MRINDKLDSLKTKMTAIIEQKFSAFDIRVKVASENIPGCKFPARLHIMRIHAV